MDYLKIQSTVTAIKEEHNITQEQIAVLVGRSPEYLSRVLNGKLKMPVVTANELRKVYKMGPAAYKKAQDKAKGQIEQALQIYNISAYDLGKMLDTPASVVSAVRTGKRLPSRRLRIALIDLIERTNTPLDKISIDDLLKELRRRGASITLSFESEIADENN